MQKILIALGALLLLAGLLWPWLRRLPLGHLPGDILIQRDGFVFYMPLATMALVSVALTALAWLLRR